MVAFSINSRDNVEGVLYNKEEKTLEKLFVNV